MKPLKAIVFDMDGVLIDSEVLWRQVREEFAADNGMVWTEEAQRATMGCNTAMWSRIMVERLHLQERLGMGHADIARDIKARLLRKYEAHLPERPGAIEAVKLAATRYTVALASGSPNELGEFVMRSTGLDKVFQATMYGDDVEHGKPAPDIYLRVLEKLGLPPEQAVGIEDSANGILSLRAAGMGIVAAPGPEFPLAAEVLDMAGARINEMTAFTLQTAETAHRTRRGD